MASKFDRSALVNAGWAGYSDNFSSHPLSSPHSQSSQYSMDSGFLEQASTSPSDMGAIHYQQATSGANNLNNHSQMQGYNYNEFNTMPNTFQDFYQTNAPVTISLPPHFSPSAVVPSVPSFSPVNLNPENAGEPFLEIVEEPTDKPFRFRYKSEMHGTHGSLMGARTERSKRTYPAVALRNFTFAKAIIRCSLYQVAKKSGERNPHSHKLVIRRGDTEQNDPHDVEVSSQNDFTAVFQGMGIIHTKKPKIKEELIRKLSDEKRFENGSISPSEMAKIEEKAENQSKEMNLNQVCLCFQAYIHNEMEGRWIKICEPVYSNVINNMKSALVGELRICRMSSYTSPACGKHEIFMFVEKVCKTNIKVKFYKLRDDNTVEWEDFADFNDSDVHHQYGIVLKTPPYDTTKKLDAPVTVKVQLYRPSDGCVSESLDFRYKPDNHTQRKRQRSNSPDYTIPTVVNQRPDSQGSSSHFGGGMQGHQDTSASSFGDKFYQSPSGHYHENEESLFDQVQTSNITATFLDLNFSETDFKGLPVSAEEIFRLLDIEVGGESKLQTDSAVVSRRFGIKPSTASGMDCSMLDKLKTLIQLFKNNFHEEKLHEMMMSLIEAHAETGENILLDCIQLGTLEEIRDLVLILVKYKLMDVLKSTNDLDQNCFHLLIQAGCGNLLRVFSYLGVDVNQADVFGNTPLHVAVTNNYQDCVKELIESSTTIKLNELNDDGFTPLHLAVKGSNFEIVDDLVEAGADIMVTSPPTGDNVLHMAVEAEEIDMEMITFFVEAKENLLYQENNAGLNVLQLASKKNRSEELIKYLEKFYEEIYTKAEAGDSEDSTDDEIFFDEQALRELSEIFDKNDMWEKLANLMGLEGKVGEWKKTSQPAKHLFMHLEKTKKPLDEIMQMFDLLDLIRATDVINEMVVRKYEK